MTKKALLIIDMQIHFDTAHKKETIANCIDLIKMAIMDKLPIIVLEYEYNGRTLEALREYLDLYPNVFYQTKDEDDGADRVVDLVEEEGLEIDEFIVCGVNLGACVASTVRTLSQEYNYKIDLIQKACNGHNDPKEDFRHHRKTFGHKNVNIICDLLVLV